MFACTRRRSRLRYAQARSTEALAETLLRQQPGGAWTMTEVLDSPAAISSFGESESRELYLTDYAGTLYRVAAIPP